MRMTKKIFILSLLCIFALLLSACGGAQSAPEEAAAAEDDSTAASDMEEEQAEEGVEKKAEEAEPSVEFQAVEGQEMSFPSLDGTELRGIYYPAGIDGAPLIIMMHWAPGDQSDYVEIAYWLQNSGLGGMSENPENYPWLDLSWFPKVAADKTYAVFTFTFRQCEGGCQAFLRDEWLLDAQGAVQFAYNLDGIDQDNILTVGASIGSDGAADGCLYLNGLHPGSCKGAFSLSPGNYLTLDYANVVTQLGEDAIPAWCLYSQSDPESAAVCSAFEADNYTAYEIGDGHGMMLVQPDVDPNPLNLLLEFISTTIG